MLASPIRLGVLALFALSSLAIGADPAPKEITAGLTAKLVNNKESYTLNADQSGQAFRDALKKNRGKAPATPAVDCVLTLTNTSDKPVTLNLGGDATQITLKLEGPGAVTIENVAPMTMEFRNGAPTVIAPGKSLDIKISNLSFGMRGISQSAYWTEPGDYTLTATWNQSNEDNTKIVVTSDAAKVKVTK